jgi:hypothetical protein
MDSKKKDAIWQDSGKDRNGENESGKSAVTVIAWIIEMETINLSLSQRRKKYY